MTRVRIVAAFLVASLVAGGCRRAPEPQNLRPAETAAPSAPATATSSTPAAAAPSSSAMRAAWTDPAGWTRVPSSSPMRMATYRVPKADGDREDGEVSVFHFGAGKGGDVKSNLERWEKQFSGVPKTGVRQNEKTINGLAVHILEIDRGTFASGMPGEPPKQSAAYGLLGAIVEAPDGNYFFKLTGPEKTVKAAQRVFFSLLDSIKMEPGR